MSNSSSDKSYLPSPIGGGGQSSYLNKDVRQPSALHPADRSSASASGPSTESSNVLPTSSSSSSDNGVFIKGTNPPRPPHPPPPLATTQPPIKRDGTTSPKERPVLRLAMLSAQQRAEAHNNGEQYPPRHQSAGPCIQPDFEKQSRSDSDSDYGAMSGPEDNMEKLLEKHSNNALRPPTDNIAANNADITNTPDFYPINPSTQNPGVIHVSMSGHHAAQNIVDSFLGTMGKSTHEHQKKTAQSKDAAGATGTDDATPADLEAGLGRPVPTRTSSLGPTPTSLRGVYANLTKLQGRMVEYQKKRDQRVHEAERREQKRQSEEEERKKRIDERRRRDCSPHNDDRLKRRALDKLAGIRNMAYSTQVRSRTVSPSPVSMSAIGSGSDHEGSGSEPPRNSFVLQSFRTMPRPESIRHMVDEIGDKHATMPSTITSIGHRRLVSPRIRQHNELVRIRAAKNPCAAGRYLQPAELIAADQPRAHGLWRAAAPARVQPDCYRAALGHSGYLCRAAGNHPDLIWQRRHAHVETYIVRTSAGYDMHRLERTNRTIRRVLKGRISVGQGVKNIERILATPPIYPWWVMVMNYVLCSAAICPLFWNGSWRDASVAAMLGLIVSLLQLMTGRFSNYANLFEVSSAFIVSFIAALMQDYICFATVSFAGVALLLPGLAVTTSIIEMVSRNMITGTVRFVFAMARCFILGYGISVGSTLGTQVLGRSTTVNLLADQMSSSTGMGNCSSGLSKFWWFLLLPLLSISFTISISGHWRQWPSMMFAGCMAYTVSYFSGMSTALAPLAPAIAAFAMGLYANGMASFSNHRSAVEPILGGILLLVPGSLGLRTVLAFITSSGTNSGNFLYNMFATSLSIATGLFLSGMVVFPQRKKRVGLMTF
ncbi:hypothetical protein BX661DRAFT_213631 [Kickxella alabastrina]|uniref:uncharacterized protein n=1 Tax=Kickxella alabastrina TaxID=61397 RepID=UPI00221F2107|nr:uncharacterized protein BX661DRAFT_213631 [Kickxella alabastrina]KAI7826256.1 hypothetical protein BX661DRAFT_213631 [Kickxella alabastrina]